MARTASPPHNRDDTHYALRNRSHRSGDAPIIPLIYIASLIAWGVWDFVAEDAVLVAYQLLTLGYLAAMGMMYLLPDRGVPRARGGEWDRWLALASANLLTPLSLLPQNDRVPYTLLMAVLLAANALSWWGLLTLRTSFSLTPEARRLVRAGPYRYVRHPLYLAGFMIGGVLLAGAWSAAALLLFALYVATTLLRARAEERVLRDAFPEAYAAYARVTPAFLPRLSPTRRDRACPARSPARRG